MDICYICLRTDREVKVVECILAKFHDELSNYSIGAIDPQYCIECEHLLRKLHNFKDKCIKASEILQKWKEKKEQPLNLLYTLLPPTTIGLWISENNRIYTYCEPGPMSVVDISQKGPISTINLECIEIKLTNKDIPNVDDSEEDSEPDSSKTEDPFTSDDEILEENDDNLNSDVESAEIEYTNENIILEVDCKNDLKKGFLRDLTLKTKDSIHNEVLIEIDNDCHNASELKEVVIEPKNKDIETDDSIDDTFHTENANIKEICPIKNNSFDPVDHSQSNVEEKQISLSRKRSDNELSNVPHSQGDSIIDNDSLIQKNDETEMLSYNDNTNTKRRLRERKDTGNDDSESKKSVSKEKIIVKEDNKTRSSLRKRKDTSNDEQRSQTKKRIIDNEDNNDGKKQRSETNKSIIVMNDSKTQRSLLRKINNCNDNIKRRSNTEKMIIDSKVNDRKTQRTSSRKKTDTGKYDFDNKTKSNERTSDEDDNITLSSLIKKQNNGNDDSDNKRKRIATKKRIVDSNDDNKRKDDTYSKDDINDCNYSKRKRSKIQKSTIYSKKDNDSNDSEDDNDNKDDNDSKDNNDIKNESERIRIQQKCYEVEHHLVAAGKILDSGIVKDSHTTKISKMALFNKERLKTVLKHKFASCGELVTDDGVKIEKQFIVKAVDKITNFMARQLWNVVYGESTFKPKAFILFKKIQKKYSDIYESMFDIEYLRTEEEIIEEFQKRKTYDWYINAKFKCGVCYQVFTYQKVLDIHSKCHDESEGDFICSICKTRFTSNRNMVRHRAQHKIVYKCKLCPLITYYRSTMMNHYYQHKGMKYNCELCGRTYRSKGAYAKHTYVMHKNKNVGALVHACTTCGRSFATEMSLKLHISKAHRGKAPSIDGSTSVKCEHCELAFPSREVCLNHARMAHKCRKKRTPRGTDGSTSVKCEHCQLAFPSKAMCLKHVRMTHKDIKALTSRQCTKPGITCELCKAIGSSAKWLKLHMHTNHPSVAKLAEQANADRKKHLCDLCGKVYKTPSSFRGHQNSHTGARPHACPKCPARFYSKFALYTHHYTHLPPGWTCKECNKKFCFKFNLKNHMKQHTGDRNRFKCDLCGRGFLQRATLTGHMRAIHYPERIAKKRVTKPRVKRRALQKDKWSDESVISDEATTNSESN